MIFVANSKKACASRAWRANYSKLVEPVYAGTTLRFPKARRSKDMSPPFPAPPQQTRTTPPKWRFHAPSDCECNLRPRHSSRRYCGSNHTDTTVGIRDMQTAQYLPKSQRPGIRQKMKDAAKPLREPKQIPKAAPSCHHEFALSPEYLDQGTIFDATCSTPFEHQRPSNRPRFIYR